MADIDLQRKRGGGLGWFWGLLGLLLLVLIVWWAWPDYDDDFAAGGEPIEQVAPAAAPEPTAGAEEPALDLGQVLADPQAFIGTTFPDTEVQVTEVPTDRGFWIGPDGNRLFALIIDQPQEEPNDIDPGATLRITGGTFRGPDYLGQIPGEPLDQQTRELVEEQDVFLVVDERNIEVTQGGQPRPGTDPAGGVQPEG